MLLLLIQVGLAVALAAAVAAQERRRRARVGLGHWRVDFSGLLVLALLGLVNGLWLWMEWRGGRAPSGEHLVRVGPWLVPPRPVTGLLAGATLVWISVTLADVLNWRLLATLPALIAGAALALAGGVVVEAVKAPFASHFITLVWVGPLATILWLSLTGIVFGWNAGLLEIPLGVGGLAGLTFYVIFLLEPFGALAESVAPKLAMGLGLSCLAMVPFAPYLCRNTARAGAVTIGFLLGGISILGALNQTAFLVALLPLLLIGVPIFSATYTYVADLRHGGRAVAVRERRQNLDVLLLSQGYSRRQVVWLLLAGSAYLCGLALLLVAMIEVSFLVKTVVLVVGLVGGAAGFYVVLRLLPRPRGAGFPARVGEGGLGSPPHGELPHAEEVWLLGVRLHAVTYQGALEAVRGFLREGHPHMVVTSDASAVMRAQDDPEFREIVNEADLVTADGAGVVLASKLLDLPLQDKVSGCDLVADLCAVAAEEGRSVYLLGAAPGVAEEAARRLQERVPTLQVAGCHDGYFDEAEEERIVAEIREQRPGLLLVAMGIPRQEKWIHAHLEDLGVPVCIGVGGSLDVISGRKQRAPVWMQRCGLEWLYRTAKEPRRFPRLAALPRIVWRTFGELLRR